MKKKIIISIIIILLLSISISIILLVKNRNQNYSIKGNIDMETFDRLRNFEISDEERFQIINYPDSNMADASWTTYYNFDLNNKNVIYLHSSTSYLPDNVGTYLDKREYKLTNENVANIKEKLNELNKIIDEDENKSFLDIKYGIRTKNGEKKYLSNEQQSKIIEEIINIVFFIEINELKN